MQGRNQQCKLSDALGDEVLLAGLKEQPANKLGEDRKQAVVGKPVYGDQAERRQAAWCLICRPHASHQCI